MSRPRRLVTTVDLAGDQQDDSRLSLSVRLRLELADGRRVALLDGRGWSSSGPGAWSLQTLDVVEETARTVVGPDEPSEGRSPEDEAVAHRAALAEAAEGRGVDVAADDLARLPHDVEVTDRVRARLPRPGAAEDLVDDARRR